MATKTKKETYVLIQGTKWTPAKVKETLLASDKAVKKALLSLYEKQTEDEKVTQDTRHQNGVGFNGNDAQILTSFAQQLKTKEWLSPKQMALTRKKLLKYSNQIFREFILKPREAAHTKFNV